MSNLNEIKLGDMVSRPLWTMANHMGIVVQVGITPLDILIRSVYEDKEYPVTESYAEFSKGMAVKILPYRSKLSRQETVFNAMNVNFFRYNLLTNNCEHFCRRALGLSSVSPQVLCAGVALFAAVTYTLATKRLPPIRI